MVICLERGADLHMAQLMPLPLTVSCFSKIQIGFTFLVPAHPGSPGKRAVKRGCVCVLLGLWFLPPVVGGLRKVEFYRVHYTHYSVFCVTPIEGQDTDYAIYLHVNLMLESTF